MSEVRRAQNIRYHERLKVECLSHYGGCICATPGCGETRVEELELHHPGGGGNEDRAEKIGLGLRSPGGWHFYLALKKLLWPEGYEVRCRACHDKIHDRVKREDRHACAPGVDGTRSDYADPVPF
jgi:hypothetical protein